VSELLTAALSQIYLFEQLVCIFVFHTMLIVAYKGSVKIEKITLNKPA